MYTIILFAVIAMIIYVVSEIRDYGWRHLDSNTIPLSIVFGILGGLIGLFAAILIPMDYKKSQWDEEIISLKDNSSMSGHFFLGSGQINGRMVYVYYQKDNDDTYKMWQADYWKCRIRYTKNTPRIIINDVSFEKNFWNKWAIDIDDKREQTYIFEIPNGSIKNLFELDSE